jgi:hypothetical protein|tara:strand:+ start:1242 stop:1541 length:300 start_codon:yes stop_codon:yes gene_type:complete
MSSQYSKIQIRRGDLADFTSSQLVLASGEPCYVMDDTRLVVGDGTNEVPDLPILNNSAGSTAPSTSSATGVAGQLAFDADYLYVCVSSNTWKRIALTSF